MTYHQHFGQIAIRYCEKVDVKLRYIMRHFKPFRDELML